MLLCKFLKQIRFNHFIHFILIDEDSENEQDNRDKHVVAGTCGNINFHLEFVLNSSNVSVLYTFI